MHVCYCQAVFPIIRVPRGEVTCSNRSCEAVHMSECECLQKIGEPVASGAVYRHSRAEGFGITGQHHFGKRSPRTREDDAMAV